MRSLQLWDPIPTQSGLHKPLLLLKTSILPSDLEILSLVQAWLGAAFFPGVWAAPSTVPACHCLPVATALLQLLHPVNSWVKAEAYPSLYFPKEQTKIPSMKSGVTEEEAITMLTRNCFQDTDTLPYVRHTWTSSTVHDWEGILPLLYEDEEIKCKVWSSPILLKKKPKNIILVICKLFNLINEKFYTETIFFCCLRSSHNLALNLLCSQRWSKLVTCLCITSKNHRHAPQLGLKYCFLKIQA